MPKKKEHLIVDELKKINISLKDIKKPNRIENIMLVVVIVSVVISALAFAYSQYQFQIFRYEKEPRIVPTEVRCEAPSPDLGSNWVGVTLINYGLLTTYQLELTTEGFKCVKDILSYSDNDYDRYNVTDCVIKFTIGPTSPASHTFLLIANITHTGPFRYNIDYEYQRFEKKTQRIHVISCEFDKRDDGYYVLK